jgi:hypothetical protein
MANDMRPGMGGRWKKMMQEKGMTPELAGWIGRKKYGKKKMAKWSAKGRARGWHRRNKAK